MARVKTFTNGGSLLPGDLNSIEDDYEFAFSTYQTILEVGGVYEAADNAERILWNTGPGTVDGSAPLTASTADQQAFYFDPADRAAGSRAKKLRLRAWLVTNQVAPGVTFTIALKGITWNYGGLPLGGTGVFTAATVSGSTVTFATPAASSSNQSNSGDFTAPAAAFYCVSVTPSAATAAGALTTLHVELQNREV